MIRIVLLIVVTIVLYSFLPQSANDSHNIKGEPQVTPNCNGANNLSLLINNLAPYDNKGGYKIQISRVFNEDISASKTKVKVFAHCIDSNGNFITGLREKDFTKIIDSNDRTNSAKTITNFKVKEYNWTMNEPLSLAIVMDHSGSMGESRSKSVQGSLYNFLRRYKDKGDDYYITKFDAKCANVSVPNINVSEIEAFLEKDKFKIGLEGFGTFTALYDAIGYGINNLTNSKNLNKAVIVFTDGLENSSKTYTKPEQLVTYANNKNISIHTVAFGDNVDKAILADMIAAPSSGSYNYICNTDEFDFIYDYIYTRLKNYYLIEYEIEKRSGNNFVNVSCNPMNIQTSAENVYNVSEPPQIIDVFFDTGKFNLKTSNSKKTKDNDLSIQKMYDFMKSDSLVTIAIHGHTDSVGIDSLNKILSYNRANSVKEALVEKGIATNRMSVKGFGSSLAYESNSTEQGRAKNRRVEFVVLTIGKSRIYRSAEASMQK